MPRPLAVEELEAREVPAAAFDTLPILPLGDQVVLDNTRAIAVLGNSLGRNDAAVMKVGDSNTEGSAGIARQYLVPLADPSYNPTTSGLTNFGLGLVDTWATFRGSFGKTSTTAYPGFTLPYVLPNVAGEIAASNAGVALVMIGTNDLAIYANVETFRAGLVSLVQTLTSSGVVPILSTVPEHLDTPG